MNVWSPSIAVRVIGIYTQSASQPYTYGLLQFLLRKEQNRNIERADLYIKTSESSM